MARNRSHARKAPRSYPRGRIELHRGGYGFVQTAEGEFFIPRSKVRGAFPDDLVEVAPMGRYDRAQGDSGGKGIGHRNRTARVVRVVERAQDVYVGYFRHAEPFGVVEPMDERIQHDIFTPLADHPDIPDGAVVKVRIDTYPDRYSAATGTVLQVLGDQDDERIPIDLIITRHKLETEFSPASLAQAAEAQVAAPAALAEGYEDLRERFIFTIDPVDAKDFDDAVSLEEAVLPDGRQGWRLGVHIADVAAYVPWGSSVDLDARRRGTSVYLADRVIPMLPEALSNDVCSLRPGEPRRTMTVDMLVAPDGRVVQARPYPALIQSKVRLTYDQAQWLLDENPDGPWPGAPLDDPDLEELLRQHLEGLSKVADLSRQRRRAAGGLDFDTAEAKVRLDGQGRPLAIELRQRTQATDLIEDAMIMANEAVARYLRDKDFPCLYRVHDQPPPSSLEELVPVLAEFPWFKDISEARFVAGNHAEVQKVLAAAEGRPEASLVTMLVLRAMSRAVYSPHLGAHYGLASSAYAHFTSPIRRYPDLVVHRMVKAVLFGRPQKFDQEVSKLPWIAEHASSMERIAEQAERESQTVKIVELMEGREGEVFSATISGVASFGLFVQLDNTAEGIVRMADLGNEYFVLDPVRHTLTGSESGREYRLGRRMAVRLVEADRRTQTLRFRPV